MNKLPIILLLSFLSSCAVGPLVNHETARTVGKDRHEVSGGYSNAGYVFKWNYGLFEKFDIGVHAEQYNLGLRAKYSFVKNDDNGFSMALALGAGDSFGGNHYYGDLLGSFLTGRWEPYTTVRVVKVRTEEMNFSDEQTGAFAFRIDENHYSYGQYFLGTRFWASRQLFLSVEASTLFTLDAVEVSDNFIFSGALGYRF